MDNFNRFTYASEKGDNIDSKRRKEEFPIDNSSRRVE